MKVRAFDPGGYRLLPRKGKPLCLVDWISQVLIRVLAFLPVYTALVATLTLIAVWLTH